MRRKRKVKAVTASQAQTVAEAAQSLAQTQIWRPVTPPLPTEIAVLINQIDTLIAQHRQIAMPTELRAELQILTRLATEAINLFNAIAERIQFEPILFQQTQLMMKMRELDAHIDSLVSKIRKRATFLKLPMPDLPRKKALVPTIRREEVQLFVPKTIVKLL